MMRALSGFAAAAMAATATADPIDAGFIRDDAVVRVAGSSDTQRDLVQYPGAFDVRAAIWDHTVCEADAYARPLFEGAVFGAQTSHISTYGNWGDTQNTVYAGLVPSEPTTYELRGWFEAGAQSTGGSILFEVGLYRYERNAPVETLFYQVAGASATGGNRVDLGIGDLDGSLTGALLAGGDYRLEVEFATTKGTTVHVFATGRIELLVGVVPSAGSLTAFAVALVPTVTRRRR